MRILALQVFCVLLVLYLVLLPGLDLVTAIDRALHGIGIPLLAVLALLVGMGIVQSLIPKIAAGRYLMTLIMIGMSVIWEKNTLFSIIGLILSLGFFQFSGICGRFQAFMDENSRPLPTLMKAEKSKLMIDGPEAAIKAFDRQMAYIMIIGGVLLGVSLLLLTVMEVMGLILHILSLDIGLRMTTVLIPFLVLLSIVGVAVLLRKRDITGRSNEEDLSRWRR